MSWRTAWASDLSALLDTGRIDLWVHGHVHHSVHMHVPGGTVIRCNPAGTRFGNLDFDDTLIVAPSTKKTALSMEVRLARAFAIIDPFGPFPPQDADAHKRSMDKVWGESD